MDVRILGPLEILVDGAPIPLGGRKQRALVALLLLRANEVVPRASLIDALWGDDPPETARKAIAVYVSRLRAQLRAGGGAATVVTRASGYVLELDPDQLDLRRFEASVERGRRALAAGDAARASSLLNASLAMWRGSALEDLDGEPGLQADRARLDDARIAVIEDRIDADLALGRHSAVSSEVARLVDEHPFRERLCEQLMLALYGSGRQREALDVYRDTRRRLVSELGIEPSAQLQELNRRILAQDESLVANRPSRPRVVQPNRRRRILVAAAAATIAIAAAIAATWSRTGHAKRTVIAVAPNSLVRIDPRTSRVVSDNAVGNTPVSVAVSRRAVWVVNRGDRTVSRVDLRRGRVRTLGGAAFAYDIAVDAHENVWISESQRRAVARITTGIGAFPAHATSPETVDLPARTGAVAIGGGSLWVADAAYSNQPGDLVGRDSVSRVDLGSRRLVGSTRLAGLPVAIAIGFGSVWVADGTNTLSVLRPGSSRPLTIHLPRGPSDRILGVAAGAGSIWLVNLSGTVLRVDPDSRRLRSRIPWLGRRNEQEAFDIAVGAGYVWVTDRADSTVAQIDPATDRVVRTIQVGSIHAVPCGIAATANAVWVTVAPDSDCGSSGTR